jgi:streptogramin lyase
MEGTLKPLNIVARILAVSSLSGVGLTALSTLPAAPALAQNITLNSGPAALTGTVSSKDEGRMEGVVVSAKRRGSTIMVSVDSNADGHYSFPRDRLAPGVYDVTMRAIGYVLPPTSVTISGDGPAGLDLALTKATKEQFALQMSNSEWLQSAPGTLAQKTTMLRCLDCHGLQRPVYSKDNAAELAYTVLRMNAHTPNAAPDFPFFLQNASDMLSHPPSKADADLGAYIASINLSSGDDWPYELKGLPRPKGKATEVIVTTYDLPDLAAPHDTLRDHDGNVWFSDFQGQFISRLNPKTGEVTRYSVPIAKPGYATGSLMITMDRDGNIWQGMMAQAELAKLDPKTGKMTTFLAPNWDQGDARFTMIDALHSNVDGKLWTKTNAALDPHYGNQNKLFHVDIETGQMTEVPPPPGKPSIAVYGLVSDLQNNAYLLDNNFNQTQIWRVDAKTGETSYIDVGNGGGRRGHIDAQNRLWFAQFYTNRYGMYDPQTKKVTLYEVPVPFAGAYDVQYDDSKYVWGADMSTDLAQRLNPETGEWTSYLLPLSINVRHVDVQKTDNPLGVSSLWAEGQQNGKIVHIEPLTP